MVLSPSCTLLFVGHRGDTHRCSATGTGVPGAVWCLQLVDLGGTLSSFPHCSIPSTKRKKEKRIAMADFAAVPSSLNSSYLSHSSPSQLRSACVITLATCPLPSCVSSHVCPRMGVCVCERERGCDEYLSGSHLTHHYDIQCCPIHCNQQLFYNICYSRYVLFVPHRTPNKHQRYFHYSREVSLFFFLSSYTMHSFYGCTILSIRILYILYLYNSIL